MNTASSVTRSLVEAFGYPDTMMDFLAEEVVWSLPDSVPVVGGTKEGKAAVYAMMKHIFGEIYDPASVRVTIHNQLAEGNQAALRFNLQARATFGPAYNNEYSLFAIVEHGEVVRVWEYLDSLSAHNQFADQQSQA